MKRLKPISKENHSHLLAHFRSLGNGQKKRFRSWWGKKFFFETRLECSASIVNMVHIVRTDGDTDHTDDNRGANLSQNVGK
jgi:hypothetical protein